MTDDQKDKIGRLGELNGAETFIRLGDELRQERRDIIQFLAQENIIIKDETATLIKNYKFTDVIYEAEYIDAFNNF